MILINTRPSEYRARFAADFAYCGLPIVESPVLRFETKATWPGEAADYDALIFTSPAAPARRPADARWTSLPVYAVGPATAAAARAAGFIDVRRTGDTAADLVEALKDGNFSRGLHPAGKEITFDLAQYFPTRITRAVIFRAVKNDHFSPAALKVLRSRAPIIAPLFSRRSAEAFADLLRAVGPYPARVTALGISTQVLDVPGAPWNAAIVSPVPNSVAMADLLNTQRWAA